MRREIPPARSYEADTSQCLDVGGVVPVDVDTVRFEFLGFSGRVFHGCHERSDPDTVQFHQNYSVSSRCGGFSSNAWI